MCIFTVGIGDDAHETSSDVLRNGTKLTSKDVVSVVLDPPNILFKLNDKTIHTITITIGTFNKNEFDCYEPLSSMCCQCNNGNRNISFKLDSYTIYTRTWLWVELIF